MEQVRHHRVSFVIGGITSVFISPIHDLSAETGRSP